MTITITGPHLEQGATCAPILRALPAWFGIEQATQHYISAIDTLPTLFAKQDDIVIGFLSIKQHFPMSAEIYVMGVLPQYHRQGVGRSLLNRAEDWLREQNVRYLQVKTLSPSHPDPGYAKTRAFYSGMGFSPLEEFPEMWDPANPCLLMVKIL